MNITRNNYESYFLDYHEGNLPDGLRKELLSFLESNPDLKVEFENFELIAVPVPDQTFFNKEGLKKNTITIYNYKTWFIRYIENDLDADGKKEVDQFIERNSSLKPELEIFKLTKVIPDHRIVFENKKQLKHGKIIPFTPQFYRVAVAATVALLLLTYFFFRNNREQVFVNHSTEKPETKQEDLSLLHQPVTPAPENKKEALKENKPGERKSHVKKSSSPINNDVPLIKNKPNELLLTKDDEQENQLPVKNKDVKEPTLFAEGKDMIRKPFHPTPAQLSEVFSDDELRELGMSREVQPNKKTTWWDLASKGAGELAKATGTDIALNKHHDELENTNSYAVAIGSFSFSRTTNK